MTTEIERRVKILQFIGDRQRAGKNTTKAIVARYLKENKLAAGETSHKLIEQLINEGLLNKNEVHSQAHFLTVNEDLLQYERELLVQKIQEIHSYFENQEGKPIREQAETIMEKGIIVKGPKSSKSASLSNPRSNDDLITFLIQSILKQKKPKS